MKAVLHAKKRSGKWSFKKEAVSAGEPESQGMLNQAQQLGSEAVARTYQQLKSSPAIWQLEFTKSISVRGEASLGYANILAANCCESVDKPQSIIVPTGYLSLRSCTRALTRRGQTVAWAWIWPAIDRLFFTLACLIAMLTFFVVNIACLFEKSVTPAREGILLALYGEWSNRTRHVLGLLASAPTAVGIIVVGRPTTSLGQIRKQWQGKLDVPVPPLCRPFTVMSSVFSLPKAIQSLVQGFWLIPKLEYRPPFRELVSIAFRVVFGASSQHWWEKHALLATSVVYGHTGLADTTMLEQAQQASGGATIHAIHGISNAYNFTGRSTRAIFRCGYDAKWYGSLGCYGDCDWSTLDCPAPCEPGSDITLFSNLSHPMNLYYLTQGCGEEKRLLKDVYATVRSIANFSDANVFWKPHPALAWYEPADFDSLRRYGQALGYSYIESNSIEDALGNSRVVLTTPSTVVLEALQRGLLPIVLNWQGIKPSGALSRYPLMVNDSEELRNAIGLSLDSVVRRQKLFEAWEGIAPAKPLAWSCLGVGG